VITADQHVADTRVLATEWPAAVSAALLDGWRFAGLYATGEHDDPTVRGAFTRAGEHQLLSAGTTDRRIDSIIDIVPAAAWDEREAHDTHGWDFTGHEPMRPLVHHPTDPDLWTTPLTGPDTFRVAVGPIHAGVIESGHFRFSVVGERILLLDLQLFHKHRGLQLAAQGEHHAQAIRYAQRACAADAVANTVAYAQACEIALDVVVDAEIARARTLLLELERLYNHLNDIAAICAGVGFAPGNMLFAALKERAQRLNAELTGHRVLFDTVHVRSSPLAVDAGGAQATRDELRALRGDFDRGWRDMSHARSLRRRLTDVGVTTQREVEQLGGVGPVARAAGVAIDARTASPRLAYPDFRPATPGAATGDVAARWRMRHAELQATFDLLDGLLVKPLAAAVAPIGGRSSGDHVGMSTVESPRGQTLCVVELDDERVARLHLRTGSYANWPLLALAARNELLGDFPLINKSFELCYACVDR
jgi:Ni,Fe-hydrogenase III large subunit